MRHVDDGRTALLDSASAELLGRGSGSFPGMHVPFDPADRLPRRDLQFVGRLEVEPELRRVPEVARQAEQTRKRSLPRMVC